MFTEPRTAAEIIDLINAAIQPLPECQHVKVIDISPVDQDGGWEASAVRSSGRSLDHDARNAIIRAQANLGARYHLAAVD
jgi:hypothetical protein